MSTDRELLELSAKAAGEIPRVYEGNRNYMDGVLERWNPLTDDGDALRLSVALGFCVSHWPRQAPPEVMVGYRKGPNDGANWVEEYGSDPLAATRRAIVCAAAEIGRLL